MGLEVVLCKKKRQINGVLEKEMDILIVWLHYSTSLIKRKGNVQMDDLVKEELKQKISIPDENETEQERFVIDDLDKANWAMKKIRAYTKRVEEKTQLANDEVERIRHWLESETKDDKQSIEYFENLLVDYYRYQKMKDDKFKLSTPYGKVTSRRRQPKAEIDDEKAIEFMKMKAPRKVEFIEKYNKNDLKKLYEIVEVGDELKAVDENGELLDFIKLEPQDDSFTVKVED